MMDSKITHLFQYASSASFILFNFSAHAGSRLEAHRVSSERAANLYFVCLLVFTAIVAAGILMELPEELSESKLRTRLGRFQWKYRDRLKPLARYGTIVVLFGVAGEPVFEWLMVSSERDVRKDDNEIIVRLQSENLKLAKELAELQKASSPRTLDQNGAANRLLPFKGVNASVLVIPDFEARRTSALIVGAIQLAKWHTSSWVTMMDVLQGFLEPGIWIELGDFDLKQKRKRPTSDKVTEAAKALVKVLKDNGIESAIRPRTVTPPLNGLLPYDSMMIFVGLRPIPGAPKGEFIMPKLDSRGNAVLP